ncbi:MAG: alpha/beta hydrolase [Thaumarchaeota archaeon]|nr:alpha/beta hydrolase [Nitrososphaerota archaeon]
MATFVLVPGAWLGGWAWKKVTPLLEQKGHEVHAVTLTGMGERVHLASQDIGLETAIQDVLNTIKYNDLEDVVLVGHSFAGKVVAAVADRADEKRVGLVLFLDAFIPEDVRTPQGDFSREGWPTLEDGWRIPLTESILGSIGKDVQGADREWMLSKVTPWLMRYAGDPVTLSEKWHSAKKAYILCTGGGDDVEQILKRKLDGPTKVIESGHWPMISKPGELVENMLLLTGAALP